ncbi:hypothetical protein MKW94_009449 [Papaver nudicaule]|uniref:GATA-type domain-containing protein n=1 Tax=Papaver nudicaule TaxID=74823 RepID=A0AA41V1T5_PAPNU|nr:hypothetical protein [Papaver nudicaule]
METPLEEEVRRLKILLIRFSAEIDRKNKKMKYMGKMLEQRSMSLSRMTEERDHLYQAYSKDKRKMKRTMYENERLMKELETQRKEIEQQAKEIEKRYALLDLKCKQLLVLKDTATRASRKLNTVQKKREGVKNTSRRDKVQVQIDTDCLHKELEENDSELDNELNRKQTLVGKENSSNHDLQEACKVSIEDDEIADLDWLSTFDENSLSAGGITLDIDFSNNTKKDDSRRLCRSNPVSILENNSSCSGGKTMPLSPDTDPVVPIPVRRKRPRSANFNQQPTLNLVSPKSCTINVQNLPMSDSYISSKSDNFAESHPPYKSKINGNEQQKKQKKKKKKRLPPSLPSYSSDHGNPLQQQQQQPGVAVQKCLHCEITETPEWRQGPMGPRTLCNACGQRYRLGRLFPEYRPAASPTFVASMHSSSHSKVLEMVRVKDTSLQIAFNSWKARK